MKKQNSVKRSLVASLLVLCLCFTALAGTTFAWFTDSAVTGSNVITAGNLDIDVEYTLDGQEWKELKNAQDLFQKGLWEPGHTEVVALKITNAGDLALKYVANLKVLSETKGKNANGDDIVLSDLLVVSTLVGAEADVATAFNNEDALAYTGTALLKDTSALRDEVEMMKNDVHYLIVKVDMPDSIGNEANYYGETAPKIDLGIEVLATQYTHENDSFGNQYDANAKYLTSAATIDAFFAAIEEGNDVLLEEQISINKETLAYMNSRYPVATFALADDTETINTNAVIDGNGITVYRTEKTAGKPLFAVDSGYTLTLSNITLDGGAIWGGEADPTLERGIVNTGMNTSANIISVAAGAHIVLNEGAIVQNNSGENAISLTRNKNGSSLTLDGGEIINNTSAAGAIWGGGAIVLNSGKINGNHATSIGGAIRMLDNNAGNTISFTMNGGEMNHNKSNGSGGAIWSGNNSRYYLNGGEMAYNSAASGGGAIWGGIQDIFYITGDFEMHHNVAGELGNAIRLSHYRWQAVEFEMTGGHIYDNDAESGGCAIYANNNPVFLKGGVIDDVISYNGNDYLTVGNTKINGCVEFNHDGRGDYKILLESEFAGFNFVVEEDDALFTSFMLDPVDNYVYTEGDEAKLVCMNEGYSTYWDATTGTFRLQAD